MYTPVVAECTLGDGHRRRTSVCVPQSKSTTGWEGLFLFSMHVSYECFYTLDRHAFCRRLWSWIALVFTITWGRYVLNRLPVHCHEQTNWKEIAAEVGSRNHVQCLQRWKKVLTWVLLGALTCFFSGGNWQVWLAENSSYGSSAVFPASAVKPLFSIPYLSRCCMSTFIVVHNSSNLWWSLKT